MLENSAIDYIEKSKSGHSISELNFNKPELDINNEVEALSNTVNQMTEDIKEYMLKVISAEEEALFMKKVANTDSLTGARNKLSYDEKLKEINTKISKNLIDNFGIIMLDVNYLKKINDTYGHKYGDLLIKNFCTIICDIFVHSPVYRIGGDEFVVILQKRDLQNADDLIAKFEKVMEEYASDSNLQPWEAPSVAFGISYYDRTTDTKAEDVFKRADEAMYQKKKEMKALRTD